DFFLLKSYVKNLLLKLGADTDKLESSAAEADVFDEGLRYMKDGKEVGSFGKVTKDLLKAFDIRQDVYYADLSWEMILQFAGDNSIVSTPVPKFPEVRRDLALLIDKEVRFEQIREIAFKTENRLLRSVGLFDVYEGDKIGKDKISYAVSFVFRDDEKTLTDKIIDRAMRSLVTAFEKQLDASVR
ncbi:MAG: phenylalanine--tRNA ligase subunit beta, partial [Bacteroidales bacterium]|nr:phenylalanine--tRNA ligase subunit beta [Bacteroidales bacterium]